MAKKTKDKKNMDRPYRIIIVGKSQFRYQAFDRVETKFEKGVLIDKRGFIYPGIPLDYKLRYSHWDK